MTIHPCRHLTSFVFCNIAITSFISSSLPLTNLRAHGSRFLGLHLFSCYPLYLVNLIHTYGSKYLLWKRNLHLQLWPWSFFLPLRLYNWIFTSLPMSQESQGYLQGWVMPAFSKKTRPSALSHCTSSFPLFPTSCSSIGLHPWSPVCYLSHDVFHVQTIRLYWVSTIHILPDTRDMKMINTWTQFSRAL